MLPDILTFKILKKRTCSAHISQTHSSQPSTTNSTCFSLFSHVDKLLYFSFGRACCNYRNCSNSANIDIYLSKTLRDESKSSSLYCPSPQLIECAVMVVKSKTVFVVDIHTLGFLIVWNTLIIVCPHSRDLFIPSVMICSVSQILLHMSPASNP